MMPPAFLLASAFVFGAVVGSFLNVCIYRLPEGRSIVSPPSSCPNCGNRVRFYDNVPILSFFMLGGRCRFCRSPISWRYPVVEALNGVLWALMVYRFGLTASGAVFALLASALVVVTFIDLDHQIIPDAISIPGAPLALALGSLLVVDPFQPGVGLGVRGSLLGTAAGYGLFSVIFWTSFFYYGRPSLTVRLAGEVVLYLFLGPVVWTWDYLRESFGRKVEAPDEENEEEAPGQGLGMGDVKLMTMLGGLIGWKGVLLTTFSASLFGSIAGLTLVITRGGGRKSKVPFGPFLSLGAVLSLLLGDRIVGWYLGHGP